MEDIEINYNEVTERWVIDCKFHGDAIGSEATRDHALFRAGFHVGYSH